MAASFPQTTITTIPKSRSEEVRLSVGEYKGKVRVDMRSFVLDDDDEFIATKKGVSLTLDQYVQFTAGYRRLDDLLVEKGLIPRPVAC